MSKPSASAAAVLPAAAHWLQEKSGKLHVVTRKKIF